MDIQTYEEKSFNLYESFNSNPESAETGEVYKTLEVPVPVRFQNTGQLVAFDFFDKGPEWADRDIIASVVVEMVDNRLVCRTYTQENGGGNGDYTHKIVLAEWPPKLEEEDV